MHRQADGWYRSLRILIARAGSWDPSASNMATFGSVSGMPSARHALRRFYENNAKVLTTVPKDALTVVDFTEPGAAEAATRYDSFKLPLAVPVKPAGLKSSRQQNRVPSEGGPQCLLLVLLRALRLGVLPGWFTTYM